MKAPSGENIWGGGDPSGKLTGERIRGRANGPSGRSLHVVILNSISRKSKAHMKFTQVQGVWFLLYTNGSWSKSKRINTVDWGS